jgi:hypothetical protein
MDAALRNGTLATLSCVVDGRESIAATPRVARLEPALKDAQCVALRLQETADLPNGSCRFAAGRGFEVLDRFQCFGRRGGAGEGAAEIAALQGSADFGQ